MTKAMFGIAAGLVLAVARAWAGDEQVGEKGARGAIATTDDMTGSSSDIQPMSKPATARVVDAGRGRGALEESAELRASRDPEYDEDRWMREPEGRRDRGQ